MTYVMTIAKNLKVRTTHSLPIMAIPTLIFLEISLLCAKIPPIADLTVILKMMRVHAVHMVRMEC